MPSLSPTKAVNYAVLPTPTATHPSAAYPSQDFAENVTPSTRLKIVHYWRRELQSDYWPNKRKLEPGGHDARRSDSSLGQGDQKIEQMKH